MPGATLNDALRVVRTLAAEGHACTLGYFDDGAQPPREVAEQSAAIVDVVATLDRPGYVSIKAPALRYELEALDRVLARCRLRAVRAHFDSHDLGHAEMTLACAERALDLGGAAGLTLPGRWRRSLDDAEHVCALGIRARVVKGEWPDPEQPRADARAGFLAVVDALVAHGAAEVAVATHDPPLAREALRRLGSAGVRCELELLHGLPRRGVLAVAQEIGVPVRVYVPYGIAWRPYALRQALRRPRILWWLARDLAAGVMRRP